MNDDTLTRSLSFFLSLTFIHIAPSLGNGLTLHRWLSVGTSSEVLMGHTHDDQVNKQPGWGGGDRGTRSKFRITGKSLSSVQDDYLGNLLWSAARLKHCYLNRWQMTNVFFYLVSRNCLAVRSSSLSPDEYKCAVCSRLLSVEVTAYNVVASQSTWQLAGMWNKQWNRPQTVTNIS